MKPDPKLEAYLAVCKDMYDRMRREGSWPWREDDDKPDEPNENL